MDAPQNHVWEQGEGMDVPQNHFWERGEGMHSQQLAGGVLGALPLQAASPACPGCEGCQEGPAQQGAAAGTFLPAGRAS